MTDLSFADAVHRRWTTRSGTRFGRPTPIEGVSTVAEQRRRRRLQEQADHDARERAREDEQVPLLRELIRQRRRQLRRHTKELEALNQENINMIQFIEHREHRCRQNVDSSIETYTKQLYGRTRLQQLLGKLPPAPMASKGVGSDEASNASSATSATDRRSGAQFSTADVQPRNTAVAEVDMLRRRVEERRAYLRDLKIYRGHGQHMLAQRIDALKQQLERLQQECVMERRRAIETFQQFVDEHTSELRHAAEAAVDACAKRTVAALPLSMQRRLADDIIATRLPKRPGHDSRLKPSAHASLVKLQDEEEEASTIV